MDSKKKRNKKKKGNQGKNTVDVTANAGEAAHQHHNHESPIDHPTTDHPKGSDADDAMSSVGEGVPQYQNHQPTLQGDRNGINAYDSASSIGEGIPYQSNQCTMTQENHKASNAVPADQRSIGMSESSVELDMHRPYYEAKLSTMEGELEKLHSKVDFHAQNEVLLEEKLNSLQSGYDVLIKKEAVLKERLSGLEETNKALLVQVKVLEEASNNTFEENQMLVKRLDQLDARLQALEAKAALSEAPMIGKVLENKGMGQVDLASSLLHEQTAGLTEDNKQIAKRDLISSLEITPDNICGQINNSPSNAYACNHPEETLIPFPEVATNNSIVPGRGYVNEHRFDGPGTTEEIIPVPLDDIQIHEDDPRQTGADNEIDEVPFSDAPIIGAPFRLISFVARYVSGADLVNQK
ncbi:hypothetical protein BS78_01G364300 [Paspalum vaginatum]|nr:hypothetical protein BS78_01G364300 [Paspalum vaginatum]KAJ1297282.1 hypothetical protein BS78_01G364300 [Paspalum vaginatum]